MVTQLIKHERIKTTLPKAKELTKLADKIITLAKRNTRVTHRLAYAFVTDRQVLPKLFRDLRLRYHSRLGGYTRVLKCGYRPSDKAAMAYIEYVENDLTPLRDRKANNAKFGVVREQVPEGTKFSFTEKSTGRVLSAALSINNRFKDVDYKTKSEKENEHKLLMEDLQQSAKNMKI
eukprot:gene1067-1210_t